MDHAHEANALPENYEVELPVRAGLMAGVAGSLSIMVVVAGILVLDGRDIFTAARLIATVVYGPEAAVGVIPIVIGTVIHLIMGGLLGAIFAWTLPRMPRGFWIVAGLIYGIGAWTVSSFIVLPVIAPPMIAADTNIHVLLIAHVAYGFIIGSAGASYGLWWRLPERLESLTLIPPLRRK
jgi:hypothetical protein